MATILNDPRVRSALAGKGLTVPEGTVFVGGFHDTGAGSAVFFDSGVVPETRRQEFETARGAIASACLHGGQSTSVEPNTARSRNAITIVGRREIDRGLSLDGRVALASYDPSGDDVRATILSEFYRPSSRSASASNSTQTPRLRWIWASDPSPRCHTIIRPLPG